MKISPINFLPNNSKNYFKSPENTATQQFFTKPDFEQKSVNFSGEYFRACLNIKNDFRAQKNNINFGNLYHKSISSTKPQYGLCECGYDDVDKFSCEFAQKINSQIQNPSLEDVENLISNVQNATGADEKLVKEVIFRLSQFSTFNSLYFLKRFFISKKEIPNYETDRLNLASAISYLFNKFDLRSMCHNPVSFIDDFILKEIEEHGIVQDELGNKSYILDGFDVLTSEGKYAGANFMSGSGYLEALSIDVIKQIQSGRDIEDIMHGDLEKRAKKAFEKSGNDFFADSYKIDVIRKPMPENISSKDILGNLKEKTLNSKHIAQIIKEEAQYQYFDDVDMKYNEIVIARHDDSMIPDSSHTTLLMKYLDNFAYVFSAHSMSEIFNKMYQKMEEIEARTGRKNMYVTPNTYKSFALITYMFMKNNEIGIENWCKSEDIQDCINGRNFVIFDDCTISNDSQAKALRILSNGALKLNDNVYYATIVSSQTANRIYEDKNIYSFEVPDFIDTTKGYLDYSRSLETELSEKLGSNLKTWGMSYDDIDKLSSCYMNNHKGSATCLAFPYMLPDNNSYFSSKVLGPLLVCSK